MRRLLVRPMTVAFPAFARLAGGVLKGWARFCRPLPGLAATVRSPSDPLACGLDTRRERCRCAKAARWTTAGAVCRGAPITSGVSSDGAWLPCNNKYLQYKVHFSFGFVFDFAILDRRLPQRPGCAGRDGGMVLQPNKGMDA